MTAIAHQFMLWGQPGEKRRDRGTTSVLSHFAAGELRTAITLVACRGRDFTSEDVLRELGASVLQQLATHPNALGAAMRSAATEGTIEPTGRYVKAQRPEAHSRKIAVWRLRPRT